MLFNYPTFKVVPNHLFIQYCKDEDDDYGFHIYVVEPISSIEETLESQLNFENQHYIDVQDVINEYLTLPYLEKEEGNTKSQIMSEYAVRVGLIISYMKGKTYLSEYIYENLKDSINHLKSDNWTFDYVDQQYMDEHLYNIVTGIGDLSYIKFMSDRDLMIKIADDEKVTSIGNQKQLFMLLDKLGILGHLAKSIEYIDESNNPDKSIRYNDSAFARLIAKITQLDSSTNIRTYLSKVKLGDRFITKQATDAVNEVIKDLGIKINDEKVENLILS